MNKSVRLISIGALAAAAACSSAAPDGEPAPTAESTTAAITAQDLRTELTTFAHDSMMGREAGTLGNYKATEYLAAEAQRFGLEPAGDDGTYFQELALVERALDNASSISVDGNSLTPGTDWVPMPRGMPFGSFAAGGSLDGARGVYGGSFGDTTVTLPPEKITGNLVVLGLSPMMQQEPDPEYWSRFESAAGIALPILDFIPAEYTEMFLAPQIGLERREVSEGPLGLMVSGEAAATLVGASLAPEAVGAEGPPLEGGYWITETPTPYPARNVVGGLPGGDPAARGQYVAIGSHNDHDGIRASGLDHDSVRAFNSIVRPGGAESEPRPATADEQAQIAAIRDSLRLERPAQLDSVYNGADDDGSGSVTMLEIAEAFAKADEKPRRSILFVWHTGEEKGLLGAGHYTANPTVPRDSIVAQINLDMVGRGGTGDVEGGGPGYLQVIGSRRLSTELGDLVESVNEAGGFGFEFDYQYDADGHPQMFYCRSDHYEYARYGIPIVFFTTGSHMDYHQVTDEARYIDYEKMARVARFVYQLALTVADLDHRVVVDKPKPDPDADCVQ